MFIYYISPKPIIILVPVYARDANVSPHFNNGVKFKFVYIKSYFVTLEKPTAQKNNGT